MHYERHLFISERGNTVTTLLETLAPINLGYSKRNCVLNMRLRGAYCENQDGGSWDTEMPHTAGEEDYPSQLCGISHFSQIIPALELRTTDLQDLDSSISWTLLELSRVMDTQSGSGSKERTLAEYCIGIVISALEACHHTSREGCQACT